MTTKTNSRVIVALDVPDWGSAILLADKLDPTQCAVKVGKELFTAVGPLIVQDLVSLGHRVFLDLKWHDIPATVAGAVRAAVHHGVWMMNVHASGGSKMLLAARKALDSEAEKLGLTTERKPLLIGVTILTSLDEDGLEEIGYPPNTQVRGQVLRLARLAKKCGLDGVVCSAQEAKALSQEFGPSFKLVTPGIRLPEGSKDDQARITTPEQAIRDGATYLVVGRPITAASDPAAALADINQRATRHRSPRGLGRNDNGPSCR